MSKANTIRRPFWTAVKSIITKPKWLAIIILVGIILFFTVFDTIRANGYTIELMSITSATQTDEPQDGMFSTVVADGSKYKIVVRITDKKGKPQVGHSLRVVILEGGGNINPGRGTTDENGEIVLSFQPLRASKYSPASNVKVEIKDESNSVFFMISAKLVYEIQVEAP